MKVPLLDLKPQYAQIKDKVVPEVLSIMESQGFILGPRVEKMEQELAAYTGAKYAVGVSSGTDALLLSLMALGIGTGDEVITTPYSFFATAGAIARVGARAVFVDIEPDTYNIDASKIAAAITPRTKAILPVHLFGQCADMDAIMSVARQHKLPVIEDACQSIGSSFNDKQAGTIGDFGCFSFFPSKNLGCFGDGGLVTTNDEQLYQHVKKLRVHGGERQYHHLEVGINGRLDALQAAVISVKLPHLAAWTEGRRKNAARYNELLAGNKTVRTPVAKPGRYHIYNQYVISVERRDELKQFLTEKEIGCAVYYPLSLHEQECFKSLGYKHGDFPNSEAAAQHTLALPVYSELPDGAVEYVASAINEFTKR
ncbi:MAG TPA: DegT/DnrJ/EryC1/StrS family aminotransferase [Candidatus Ozemobacteraceae bacterium]|nr:DegT/DnrJ/EryC1/StrS family aminotransferase [Candidatus Ozemobacteraceae bacterium]